MKKGDVVMIYEYPADQKKPEGKAQLMKQIKTSDPYLERWEVRFFNDPLDCIVQRFIKKEDIKMKCRNCKAEVDEVELSDMDLCEYCEETLKEEAWELSVRGEPAYDEEYDYGEDIDPQETQAINQAVREIRRRSNL